MSVALLSVVAVGSLRKQGRGEAWDPPACTFAQDGPYKPQSWRTSLEMPEGSSAKKLALTLTFPSDATKTVLPLLFVSGFMMSASDYVPYATRLASHGYFVVQYDTGRLVADKEECGYARVIREALPSLAAQAPGFDASLLDATRLASAGHSRGGKMAALHAAEGISATAFLVDPVDSDGGSQSPSAVAALKDRGMALGLVGAGVTGRCNPEGRNWKEFHRVIGPGSWFELVVDAGHAHFVFPPQPWRQAYRLLCGGGRLSCQATIDLTLPAMLGWLESEYRKVDISQSGLKDWAAYWVANHVIAFDQLPGNVAAPEAARDVAEPALVPA